MAEVEFLTRCPNCETSFNVTQVQLNAANGAVRCGACLRIFQGPEHIISKPDGAGESQQTSAAETGESADPDVEAPASKKGAKSPAKKQGRGGSKKAAKGSSKKKTRRSSKKVVEESQPEGLLVDAVEDVLEELAAFEEAEKDSEAGGAAGEEVEGAPDEPSEDTLTDGEAGSKAEQSGAASTAQLESALDEAAEGALEEQAEGTPEEPAEGPLEEPAESALKDAAEGVLEEPAESALEEPVEGALEEHTEGALQERVETADTAAVDHEINLTTDDDFQEGYAGEINVETDPHEIVGAYVEHKGNFSFLWFTLALLAAAALVFQFAWYNRDVLSQELELRDYYLSYCNFAGCAIPEFVDLDALSATRLVVRTHPQVEHALIIDAIVQNTAGYRQLFPLLQLQFIDSRGKPVASRQFPPGDYLRGELTGLRYIPANTEVRLSLEIVDPGEQSMGYSMIVVPN